jgi:hypothetical protein
MLTHVPITAAPPLGLIGAQLIAGVIAPVAGK